MIMFKLIDMKIRNLFRIFCVTAFAIGAVACSDDEDKGGSTPSVTEPLSAPENITYTASLKTLSFSWNSVSNATSYEVSLAPASAQNDKTVSASTSASFTFSGLEVNTSYVFEVKAIYGPNSEFDSDYSGLNASTLDYYKLSPPTNLRCTSVTKDGATIAWDVVVDADSYQVVMENSAGGEVVNLKQTATTYSKSGLIEDEDYTVYVYALLDYGDGEYDSDAATLTFTTGLTPLTAPPVSLVYKSHALAIMEWEYTSAMLSEQGWSVNPHVSQGNYSDKLNFRLCDSNGNVLREIDGMDDFYFLDYPYTRVVWGGLTPNTTYRLEVQRCVTGDEDVLGPSAWASVEVTTDPAPDTSGYLLYWDFDNVPFNASPMWIAYGFARVTSGTDDWANPDNMTYTANYTDNSIEAQPLSKSVGQTFFDQYFPGLDIDNYYEASGSLTFTEGTTHNLSVQAGNIIFSRGTGAGSWLSLPLANIEEDSTICLEISACPFANCSTGNVWGCWNGDEGTTFTIEVSGGANIDSVEADHGKTDSTFGTIASLNNVSVRTGMSEADHGDGDPFYYTNHTLIISGVGPETNIVIYTAVNDDHIRMWADNIKVSLVE